MGGFLFLVLFALLNGLMGNKWVKYVVWWLIVMNQEKNIICAHLSYIYGYLYSPPAFL